MPARSSSQISVIMPVYNAALTLSEALDSLQVQQHEDWELIAVDDGSTDHSLLILQEYALRDPRIQIISGPHKGIVPALQCACAEACGELLARMDADDIALPQRLSVQARSFQSEPALDLCGARVLTLGEAVGSGRRRYESWVNGLMRHEEIVRELFVECPVPHPTFMMRRSFFECLGGYQQAEWPEDYDLVLRAWRAGARFGKPELPLLRWREHAGRLSMTDPRYSPEAFRKIKRHYLFQTYLKGKEHTFIQWGAGEVGKKWLREWPVPPVAVVDIHPRKIGCRIHGVPIIPWEALPPPGSCFVVVAVGARGARNDIRARIWSRGYHELADYLFIA